MSASNLQSGAKALTNQQVTTWERVQPWDEITYWFSGIYKIVSYRDGEFLAYFIPDHYLNWGDYVSPPPDNGRYSKCWSSLETAKAACETHAAKHTPKPRTVKRAAEIKATLPSAGGAEK